MNLLAAYFDFCAQGDRQELFGMPEFPDGELLMADYRIYKLDKQGRTAGPPNIVSCEDDDAALILAQQHIGKLAIEIWADARRVAFIPAHDE